MAPKSTNHRAATVIGKPRTLVRWGNRLAVRLSSEVLAAAEVTVDQPFTMEASDGCIRLVFQAQKPTRTTKSKLWSAANPMRLSDLVDEVGDLGSEMLFPTLVREGKEVL